MKMLVERGDQKLFPLLLVFCLIAQATPRAGQREDCGKLTEDQVCCGGRVYERNLDRVCCTLQGYSDGEKAYVPYTKCINNVAENAFETCGSDQFDSRFEDCCGDTERFNRLEKRCCVGYRGATVVSLDTACCNGLPLNAPGEMCCSTTYGDVSINKTHPAHTSCCVPHDIEDLEEEKRTIHTYDKATHYCHSNSGSVRKLPSSRRRFPLRQKDASPRSPSSSSSSSSSPAAAVPAERNLEVRPRPTPLSSSPSDSPLSPSSPYYQSPSGGYDNSRACLQGRRRMLEGEEGGEGEGEEMRCCDQTPFRPAHQTCCEGRLTDIPSGESVCCGDEAYAKLDGDNPCLRLCKGRPLDLGSQVCCGGKVVNASSRQFCCGSTLITDPDAQQCCGGMAIDRSEWKCCRDMMPYKPQVMNCNGQTGSVTLRPRRLKQYNIPSKFCRYQLDTWGKRWKALTDPDMIKVEGRVISCEIQRKKGKLTIPLIPGETPVGGHELTSCLKSQGLKLVVKLPRRDCPLQKKTLKRYLKGRILEVMVKRGKVKCRSGSGRAGIITIKEKDVAFVLSRKS